MKLNTNINLSSLKLSKSPKHSHEVYPSKTTLNMAMKGDNSFRATRAVPALIVLALFLAVFTKFGVIDRLQEVSALRSTLSEQQEKCDKLRNDTKDYESISKEYIRQSTSWMTEDMKKVVPSHEILGMLEGKIMPYGRILQISAAGDTVSVVVGKIDLEIAANFVQDLYELPSVADVQIYTAESEDPSSKQLKITFVIKMISKEAKSMLLEGAVDNGNES